MKTVEGQVGPLTNRRVMYTIDVLRNGKDAGVREVEVEVFPYPGGVMFRVLASQSQTFHAEEIVYLVPGQRDKGRLLHQTQDDAVAAYQQGLRRRIFRSILKTEHLKTRYAQSVMKYGQQ